MTVTFSVLTMNGSSANQTGPYSTANVIPAANQPVLVFAFVSIGSGTAPIPTVSGCNLTWTNIVTKAGLRSFVIALGIGASPTTGAISIAGDGTTTLTSSLWCVIQCSGVDTSSANGVVQTFAGNTAASSTSETETFPNPVNSANSAVGMECVNSTATITPGTGWTTLGSAGETLPNSTIEVQSSQPPQQNFTSTFTVGSTGNAIGVEMAAALSNLNNVRAGSGTVNLSVGSSPASAAYIGSTKVWP